MSEGPVAALALSMPSRKLRFQGLNCAEARSLMRSRQRFSVCRAQVCCASVLRLLHIRAQLCPMANGGTNLCCTADDTQKTLGHGPKPPRTLSRRPQMTNNLGPARFWSKRGELRSNRAGDNAFVHAWSWEADHERAPRSEKWARNLCQLIASVPHLAPSGRSSGCRCPTYSEISEITKIR